MRPMKYRPDISKKRGGDLWHEGGRLVFFVGLESLTPQAS
jgi:hypothetical protein